jgi:arginine repressor
MAELQIKIGADVNEALRGLDQVQTELDQTGKSATALGNSVSKAAQSFNKLPQSANQATSAITNLNRVVQDAPFGFVGIQNNIGPLVDSFGALKMSTGSTGGAIKALIGSLAGPAGVGLAIAAVSSALTFAIQGFSSWTRGLGAAKEANDKLAESVATDLVQLTTIVGLIQNTSASTSDRQKALKVLNEEYGKYLPNLDKEAITLTNINEKYQAIIDTMLRQAVVKGIQDEITKQVTEAAKQITQLQLARERERLELDKGNKSKFQTLTADQKLAQIADQKNKAVSDGVIAFNKQTQAEKAAIGTTNVYDMMIQGLKKSLMDSLAPALNLASTFSDLGETLKKGKEVKFDFTPIMGISKLSEELKKQADMFEMGIVTNAYQKKIQEGFKKLKPIPVKLQIAPELTQEQLKFKELQDKFIENFKQIGSAVQSVLAPAFQSLFDSIGKGTDVLGGFFEGLKQGVAQLIQSLIQTAAIAGIISLITGTPFSLNFKALSGIGLPGRAAGGPVSGGNPYVVGEKGPELFIPSVSGSIVPNNSAGSFMGMRGGSSSGGTVLRGQDILLAYARTQRSQLRVNG